MNLAVVFLSAHSPNLAPIEKVFSSVKRSVGQAGERATVDFSKETGDQAVSRGLAAVSRSHGVRLWVNLL